MGKELQHIVRDEKVFYWQRFDTPVKKIDPLTKKEYEINGEYVCLDDRIFKAWVTMSIPVMSDKNSIELWFHAIFKDGGRIDKIMSLPATQEGIEIEAELFLKNETPVYPNNI